MAACIEGVTIKPLTKIPDERGCIYHMLRANDELFEQFGEVYFSASYPDIIKGWHLHTAMTLNYAVIVGMIKLVLYDDRKHSPTCGQVQEIFIGEDNYALVKVPPLVWNGFKNIGATRAIVCNCATHPHDPQEILRKDPFSPDIPYDWSVQHR